MIRQNHRQMPYAGPSFAAQLPAVVPASLLAVNGGTALAWSSVLCVAFLFFALPSAQSADSLNMLFVNQTGLPDGQVFITFQDPTQTLNATYDGGTVVNRVNNNDIMTQSLNLTQIGVGGMSISNARGPVVFVSYAATMANNGFDMSADLSGNSPPSFIGSTGANYAKSYQPFEITYITGQTGGQGNLTNINYMGAPIAVNTYSGGQSGTPLQSRGYYTPPGAGGTATLAGELAKLTAGPNASLATPMVSGNVLRYIGPSSYGVETNPYPTFDAYLGAMHTAGQTTKIQNANAFNTQAVPAAGNTNYNYALDFIATVAGDKTITLSGTITQLVTPFNGITTQGTVYTDARMTISPTIGADTNDAIFNNTIYGQSDPRGSGNGSTTFNAVWQQMATDMANLNLTLNTGAPGTTYGITQSLAIGEITTGLLGGFVGSNANYAGGTGDYFQYNGMAYKDVPSEAWWASTTIPPPSTLQSEPYYSGYSETIFNATNNGVYSIPFSDRFGDGPLMQTQEYNNQTVDTWVVTLGQPIWVAVPEPSTIALAVIGLGVVTLAVCRRRTSR